MKQIFEVKGYDEGVLLWHLITQKVKCGVCGVGG